MYLSTAYKLPDVTEREANQMQTQEEMCISVIENIVESRRDLIQ